MLTASAKVYCGVLTLVCILAIGVPASADTYVLEPDGTGAFPTIQAALTGVLGGDIIELASGIYDSTGNRDLDFMGKAVTLRGQTGDPADVVIDCEGSGGDPHRAFVFDSAEGSGSVLQDVTITNGYTPGHGAAIYCHTTSPTIDGCVFDSNNADGSESYGGAIYITGAGAPTITGCTFTGNRASEFANGRGGAIACNIGTGATITDCYFANNEAEDRGGAIYGDQCDVAITDCVVEENIADSGAGIYLRYGTFVVMGCSVLDNLAADSRGGGLLAETGADIEISDCTFAGNVAPVGGGIYASGENFTLTRTIVAFCPGGGVWYGYEPFRDAVVSCCNVFDNEGGNYSHIIGDQTGINDNISVDPQFCNAESGDFTIYDTSPCSPDSSGCGQLIGAFGVNCGTPVEASSWGRVKSLYR